MLLKRGSLWEEALLHPWILTAAEYLVGRGCLLYQTDTIVKTTGQETHPGLHSDYAASRITEPFPEFCILTVAVWAIDDFLSEHGPTVIKPGSFRERRQVPAGTTQEGTTRIEMPQGSIAMWNGATWHGSTPRTAAGKRTRCTIRTAGTIFVPWNSIRILIRRSFRAIHRCCRACVHWMIHSARAVMKALTSNGWVMQPGPGSRSLVRCHNGRVEVLLRRCEVKIAVSSAVESVGFGSGG